MGKVVKQRFQYFAPFRAKDENFADSGLRNGLNPRSLYSKASNVRDLPENHGYMASEPVGTGSRYLHGSGSRFIQPNNDDYYVNGCLKYLEEFGLPSAYTVPGSNIPGSQTEDHIVNSILNTENAGDGPGSLDYDMDGSLLGYYPLKVCFFSSTLGGNISRAAKMSRHF